jgi:hypothetical protein
LLESGAAAARVTARGQSDGRRRSWWRPLLYERLIGERRSEWGHCFRILDRPDPVERRTVAFPERDRQLKQSARERIGDKGSSTSAVLVMRTLAECGVSIAEWKDGAASALGGFCSCAEGDRGGRYVVELLVRLVYQVDGCGRAQGVELLKRPLPGAYFRSGDSPSGPVARSKVDALQD